MLTLAPLDLEAQELALRLARSAIKAGLEAERRTSYRPLPGEALPAVFSEHLGAFVTLHDARGQLRGCIGTVQARESLDATIWGRAQDAAFEDPRFPPLSPHEFETTRIEISVLTKASLVSGPEAIVLGRDGIILRKGFRTSLFLPQVATEQGWDLNQTLSHLAQKAGLSSDAWQSGTSFETFQAQVFGEN